MGVVAARRAAADIDMVDQHAGDGDALARHEDRLEGEEIRQVLAAAIGIVGDDDIALMPADRAADGGR